MLFSSIFFFVYVSLFETSVFFFTDKGHKGLTLFWIRTFFSFVFADLLCDIMTPMPIVRMVENGFYWKDQFVPFTVENFRIRFGFQPEEIGAEDLTLTTTTTTTTSTSSSSSFVLVFYFIREKERTIESFPISFKQYQKITRSATRKMKNEIRDQRIFGFKPTTRIEKKVLASQQKFDQFIHELNQSHLEALKEIKGLKTSSKDDYWKALLKVNNQYYGVYAFEILVSSEK
jgi:hypothetical protein